MRAPSGAGLAVVIVVVCLVVAAIVVPLEVLGGSSAPAGTGARQCGPSGCAVVNSVRTAPRVTVFYGASCDGPRGRWFLNVVEEAPNGQPRPAYALHWEFSKKASIARPDGTITVSNGVQTTNGITMRLVDGVLTVEGGASGHTPSGGIGTLTVELTGSGSAQRLTLLETGLATVESSLGLVSPFANGSEPVSVPIKSETSFKGC